VQKPGPDMGCHLLLADFSIVLLFYTKDGGSKFLRNVGNFHQSTWKIIIFNRNVSQFSPCVTAHDNEY
jgi:hypothetical protein